MTKSKERLQQIIEEVKHEKNSSNKKHFLFHKFIYS